MSFIGNVLGSLTGAKQAGKAAVQAGQIQADAAMAGVDEQRRQFDALIQLMQPYVSSGQGGLAGLAPYAQAGAPALAQQQAFLGLSGADAQQSAISGLENSPLFQAQMQQGENAMLQNASATGGLRGGNMQAAMAQFRPQMLQQAIDQQYGRLGGLSALGQTTQQNLASIGQASAAGQAAQGMSSASNIGNLMANAGSAQAGGVIGRGNVQRNTFGDLLQMGKVASGYF